jgi:hypothetical protein
MAKADLTKPCRKCGSSEKTCQNRCKPCTLKWHSEYRSNHPDRVKTAKRKYQGSHPETISAYEEANRDRLRRLRAAWRATNTDRLRASARAWRERNRSRVRELAQHRRSRTAAGDRLSLGLTAKLFRLQKGRCACCRKPLGKDFHLDHILPLALGGRNIDENIQLLRAKCNRQKCAAHPVDFMQRRGFLL